MHATMFEAKTELTELVRRAQFGEEIILTNGREKTLVAKIVALQPLQKRPLGLFHVPGFRIPEDFDELPPEELAAWNGEGE